MPVRYGITWPWYGLDTASQPTSRYPTCSARPHDLRLSQLTHLHDGLRESNCPRPLNLDKNKGYSLPPWVEPFIKHPICLNATSPPQYLIGILNSVKAAISHAAMSHQGGPFQRGIWDYRNLFRSPPAGGGGEGGTRITQPLRNRYYTAGVDDQETAYGNDDMHFVDLDMSTSNCFTYNHASYTDRDGTMRVERHRHRPSEPLHTFTMWRDMGGRGAAAGASVRARMQRSVGFGGSGYAVGGGVRGHGIFPSESWSMRNLFGAAGGHAADIGRGRRTSRYRRHHGGLGDLGIVSGAYEDFVGGMRHTHTPTRVSQQGRFEQDTSESTVDFLQRHTQPVVHGGANAPPNTNCPICLEPPSATHRCVQIKGIPGCSHLIGRECLEELLEHQRGDKKECPLCRTEWLPEDGIRQGAEEWQRLAPLYGARGAAIDAPRSGMRGLDGGGGFQLGNFQGDQGAASYPPDYYHELHAPDYEDGWWYA